MQRTRHSHEGRRPVRYYLGIDGGQSSTTALIAAEDGRVIGAGRGGPCNHVSGPEAEARFAAVIGGCLAEACRRAGLDAGTVRFAAACLGFSGGAEDKGVHSRELIRSARFKITHDAAIALAGAMGGEPGIVIIAGTGSMAFGRNAAGRTARAGGWGYIFGDEGGAFDIARRALRAALQFEEGWGPETKIRQKLLEATGTDSANQLLHGFYAEKQRERFAALAALVSEAADAGDEVARRVLADAARALSRLVEGIYRNLFSASDPAEVAHIGGVFQSALLREAFGKRIRAAIGCEVIFPRLSPAAGALLEALRMDGNPAHLTGVPETKT